MSAPSRSCPSMPFEAGLPSNLESLAGALVPLVEQRLQGPAPLLDAEAAGALLGVPKSWVLAEAREDRIPHVRLGRYVRFQRDELEAWWQARARGPRWRTGTQPASTRRNPV